MVVVMMTAVVMVMIVTIKVIVVTVVTSLSLYRKLEDSVQ